jgi:predicted O-methyltransferase YrrM
MPARPTPVQYIFMRQLIEDHDLRRIAEVGVWKAAFSLYILENCPHVEKVYSIDPYKVWSKQAYQDDKNKTSQGKFDSIYRRVIKKLSVYGDRSEFIRDTSVSASKLIENESLDFVWIDANHGYEFVRDDIHAWRKKVRRGGIISGDDYNLDFPGTIQAVDEYCYTRRIVFSVIPGGVWYFEKGKKHLRYSE